VAVRSGAFDGEGCGAHRVFLRAVADSDSLMLCDGLRDEESIVSFAEEGIVDDPSGLRQLG
jgi:hypothetical protein